ncbi:hypothetical protein Osc7112_4899 [Oscillatoria nigro-viridis PCC 7112]|uniref:Uncharacterized protein n=1 Tax=Phormidium nigroviride PCC 7112 TaxID=179408 RepID=K9VNW0_9CYAN|nr:hypothetical protein Osc7112_4899 [Oscillatoria nigro-viridis PCC 7112]
MKYGRETAVGNGVNLSFVSTSPPAHPLVRQGMNSTGLIAKVLAMRTNEFFSPHSEDFSFEAGVSTLAGLSVVR